MLLKLPVKGGDWLMALGVGEEGGLCYSIYMTSSLFSMGRGKPQEKTRNIRRPPFSFLISQLQIYLR